MDCSPVRALPGASSPTEASDSPHFSLSGDAGALRGPLPYRGAAFLVGPLASVAAPKGRTIPGVAVASIRRLYPKLPWRAHTCRFGTDSPPPCHGGRHPESGGPPTHRRTSAFLPCRRRVPSSTRVHHRHTRSMVPGGNPGPCRQDHRGRLPECATNAIRPCWKALDVAHSTQPIRVSPRAPPAQPTESSARAAQHEISPHHGSASVH